MTAYSDSVLNLWDTHLLYERYKKNPSLLCEGEKRKLIDGLAQVILGISDVSNDSDKVENIIRLFQKK